MSLPPPLKATRQVCSGHEEGPVAATRPPDLPPPVLDWPGAYSLTKPDGGGSSALLTQRVGVQDSAQTFVFVVGNPHCPGHCAAAAINPSQVPARPSHHRPAPHSFLQPTSQLHLRWMPGTQMGQDLPRPWEAPTRDTSATFPFCGSDTKSDPRVLRPRQSPRGRQSVRRPECRQSHGREDRQKAKRGQAKW